MFETIYRTLRCVMPTLSISVLGLCVPALGQPPGQSQRVESPAASETTHALSPADEQQIRATVEQAIAQVPHLLAQPVEQNLHELIDQGLSGEALPAPFKAPFVALFAPHAQAIHQYLDQEAPRLRLQLNVPSGRRSAMEGTSPFLRAVLRASANVTPDEMGLNHVTATRPYRNSPLGLMGSQDAGGTQDVGGTQSSSASQDFGGGVAATIKEEKCVDTADSIGEGTSMEMDVTANPKDPVQGTMSGELSSGFKNCARVNRCPTADGQVAGKSEFETKGIVSVTATTGTVVSGFQRFGQNVTAEGHVGDDARLREVVVQVDVDVEKRAGSELTIWRSRGTATFDPHGSESELPLQVASCSTNQGVLPVAQCSAVHFVVFVTNLRDAYLRAERKWNFSAPEPGDFSSDAAQGSKCVIAKFTPPTRTVRAQPRQAVPLKAELIAVKGNQPTWGVFKEFRQITGDGDTQANGTRTSPDAPGELTYTAPSRPWPINDPPGFGVYRATSRAGVLDGGNGSAGYDYDDWTWFLAPGGLRLSIHERSEVHLMIASSLSEVTFPMDLMVNEQRQVVGQAEVQRESRGDVLNGMCASVDHWTEQWHASGTLDERTDILTLKLWFEAGPRQGTTECKVGPSVGSDQGTVGAPGRPLMAPIAIPGFRSDAFRSPLDRFTLPDKDGATQQFVIPIAPATHTINVTLLTAQGGGAVQ